MNLMDVDDSGRWNIDALIGRNIYVYRDSLFICETWPSIPFASELFLVTDDGLAAETGLTIEQFELDLAYFLLLSSRLTSTARKDNNFVQKL